MTAVCSWMNQHVLGSYHFSNIQKGFSFPPLASFKLKELSEVISVAEIISEIKVTDSGPKT